MKCPATYKLEEYLDAYISGAAIANDRGGPLFRSAIGRTKKLGPKCHSPYIVTKTAISLQYSGFAGVFTFGSQP